jgi:hypothetical protein
MATRIARDAIQKGQRTQVACLRDNEALLPPRAAWDSELLVRQTLCISPLHRPSHRLPVDLLSDAGRREKQLLSGWNLCSALDLVRMILTKQTGSPQRVAGRMGVANRAALAACVPGIE